MEPLMMLFLVVTVYGGYVLPLVGLVMSLREWLKLKSVPQPVAWRRGASIVAITFFAICIPLWIYAVVREFGNDYSYTLRSAQIGRWSSLVILAVSLFAESKLRWSLLIGALGLFFFFAMSIGELP